MSYNVSTTWAVVLAALAIWELIWKGIALWKAGRRNQLGWFVVMLVINSAGILPIIYLLTHRDYYENKKELDYETPVPIKG